MWACTPISACWAAYSTEVPPLQWKMARLTTSRGDQNVVEHLKKGEAVPRVSLIFGASAAMGVLTGASLVHHNSYALYGSFEYYARTGLKDALSTDKRVRAELTFCGQRFSFARALPAGETCTSSRGYPRRSWNYWACTFLQAC